MRVKAEEVAVPDVGESRPPAGHSNELVLSNPSIPMLYEYSQCSLIVLHLAERVPVDDRIIVRIHEDAWRYPRLVGARSSE
jgi:hypothetical protein